MNTAQRVLKNTISLFLSGILAQILIFFVSIYLARILGPDDFGQINFAMAIVAYFTLVGNLGLPLLGTREIAKSMEKIHYYVKNILSLRLVLSLSGFAVLVLVVSILSKSSDSKYLIVLYGLGLIPSALLLDWVFQGIEKMEYIMVGRVASAILYATLVCTFVKASDQILYIPCFQVAGSFIFTGTLFVIFSKTVKAEKSEFSGFYWKELFIRALPIGMTSIASAIIYYLDTLMLGVMKTDTEVGFYNAAYKIILLLIMGIATFHDSIFPVLASLYKTSFKSLSCLQYLIVKLMMACAIPLSVGGMILSKKIMTLLYGDHYSGAVIAFQILIFACSLIFINTAYGRGLWAVGKETQCLHIVAMQAVLVVILNFLLIPPMGLIGAGAATVAGEAFSLVLLYHANNRIFQLREFGYLLKFVVASVIMGLILLTLIDLNLFILIIIGILVYLVILYTIKGITVEDIDYIRSAVFEYRRC